MCPSIQEQNCFTGDHKVSTAMNLRDTEEKQQGNLTSIGLRQLFSSHSFCFLPRCLLSGEACVCIYLRVRCIDTNFV
jgi:hypothetical protein